MEDHSLEADVSALMVLEATRSVHASPTASAPTMRPRKTEPGWEDAAFAVALCALQTDPHHAEALRLYRRLELFVKGRVYRMGRSRYRDLLCESALEDVISEVLYQLMSGALWQFRGSTLSELLGFAKTISDRNLWRTARKRIRERDALQEQEEEIQAWACASPRPDHTLIAIPQTPLCEPDATYLLALIDAGSHAHLARELGVSRAAVTQRVQRIRSRIDQLSEEERATAESWLRHSAARKRARAARAS